MRIRTSLPFALLLALPTLAHAQTKDQRHVLTQSAALDSQAVSIATARSASIKLDSALARYCATKSPVGYLKAVCGTPAVLLRETQNLATRNATLKATETAFAAPYVPPAPVPPVVVDTTPKTPPPPPVDSTPSNPPPVVVDSTPKPPPPVVTPPPTGVIFSHPFGPPANGAQLATLPQDTVPIAYPSITRSYRISGSVQTAVDTAKAGDEIRVPTGTSVANVAVKTSNIVLRADVPDSVLGSQWTKMTRAQADALNLPTITTNSTTPALWILSNTHHVRVLGFRILATGNANALVWIGNNENTLAAIPHHVVLDRNAIDGGSFDVKRCVRGDGGYEAMVSSSALNCHSNQGDSQCWLTISTPGPVRVENNTCQGGHQSVFFGGGDPAIRGMLPSDIVVRLNDLSRPLAWQRPIVNGQRVTVAGTWQGKTTYEQKIGKRVLVEGNVMCHTWPDAQTGYAMLLKTENQDGGTWGDWSESSDITVRYNQICGAAGGLNLAALPAGPGVPMSRVTIYGNVADSLGVGIYGGSGAGEFVLVQGVNDVVLRDNWSRNVGRACLYLAGVSQRLAASGTVCGGQYGIYGENGGPSVAAPGALLTGNTVLAPSTAWNAWPAIPADSVRDALLRSVAP